MRNLAIAATLAIVATASPAQATGFSTYPGFVDPLAKVEMTTDKGLIIEIVLRCRRNDKGRISSGIMSYSKVEGLFCSSKNRCFADPNTAIRDTCGG